MVIATSDSCNTLVSLDNDIKLLAGDTRRTVDCQEEAFSQTEIYLPVDDFGDDHAQQPIYLPVTGRVDEYLKHIPEVIEACDELLANAPVIYNEQSSQRILYVAQGEVAHAVPLQCDVLVSDKATTCHILGFRSESADSLPLTSLAHLDGSFYENCIRSMIREHIAHHQQQSFQEEKKDEFDLSDDRIDLQVHVVGGFEDCESTSSNISGWLMHLLADIAREFSDSLKMTLKTCAISCLNDTGYACPIGRGLAIDLRSGNAFLAKAEDFAVRPAIQLRSVRLWAGDRPLSIIHTQTSNDVRIDAFSFAPFPELEQLLELPDRLMLQYTSTSPDVEETGFCDSVRSTLRFLRETPCTTVFGPRVDKPLVFRRTGASNHWKRTA